MRRLLKWLGVLLLVLVIAAGALWFFLFRPPPPGTPLAEAVATSSGPVRGLEEGGVSVYRGIPYAAPPVGNLRWRAPQPVAAWSETRDAFNGVSGSPGYLHCSGSGKWRDRCNQLFHRSHVSVSWPCSRQLLRRRRRGRSSR